jgi:hypothetical protein
MIWFNWPDDSMNTGVLAIFCGPIGPAQRRTTVTRGGSFCEFSSLIIYTKSQNTCPNYNEKFLPFELIIGRKSHTCTIATIRYSALASPIPALPWRLRSFPQNV